jgi:hypothetical protein
MTYSFVPYEARVFDELHIMIEDELQRMFDYADRTFFNGCKSVCPALFDGDAKIASMLPETISGLGAVQKDASSAMRATARIQLLSWQKKTESGTRANVAKRRKQSAAVSSRDLALFAEMHDDETDGRTLRRKATNALSGVVADVGDIRERHAWSRSLVAHIDQRGHIDDARTKLYLKDVGLGMISKARQYFAEHADADCPAEWLSEQAAHLRPYHQPTKAGTCRSIEREDVRLSLGEALARELQTPPDVDMDDAEDEGEEEDADADEDVDEGWKDA